MIDLHQGDCLELMKDIPDGSVDMILGMELDENYFNIAKQRIEEAQKSLDNTAQV